MAQGTVQELEQAAQIILAPPNLVTVDQRHAAENVFIQFKKSQMPYGLCKEILELGVSAYVQFQVASTIKECVARDWGILEAGDILALRSFLVQYVMQNTRLESYVREQILSAVAIMVKRSTLDKKALDNDAVFRDVAQLIEGGNPDMQLVGCAMLLALLTEFSISGRSSSLGLSWENHATAKLYFQNHDLKRVFTFCLQVLEQLAGTADVLSPQVAPVVSRVLAITEQVLTWHFLPKNIMQGHVGSFTVGTQNISFKPPRSWHDVVLKMGLLDLLFAVHQKVRGSQEMCHLSLQCLAQLATLNGPVYSNEQERVSYLTHFVQTYLKLICSGNVADYEALGLAQVAHGLLLFFQTSVLAKVPRDLLVSLLEHMDRITCSFGQNAAREEAVRQLIYQPLRWYWKVLLAQNPQSAAVSCSQLGEDSGGELHDLKKCVAVSQCEINASAQYSNDHDRRNSEDSCYLEAYDRLLEGWMSLLTDSHSLPTDALKQHTVNMFNSYLHCHLSPPDGSRGQGVDSDDTEEYQDVQEDDRDLFRDQLTHVGNFGRHSPQHVIPLLTRLLEDRVSRMHGQLQRVQQSVTSCPGSPGPPITSEDSILNSINEDLHWLLLITAYVLTDEFEGETLLVPKEIMEYSISQASNVNMQTTLQLLASPGADVKSILPSDSSADTVVRLVSGVLRLCEVERRAWEAGLGAYLSPQVASSAMWLLRRWLQAYLLPDETYYQQMSLALTAAFGRDTEGGMWTVGYLVDKMVCNLQSWAAEPAVVTDTIDMMVVLVEKRERCNAVVKCSNFWKLAKAASHGEQSIDMLPAPCKRQLYKGLIYAGSATFHGGTKDNYWQLVLESLATRYTGLVGRTNLKQSDQRDGVKVEVVGILECLCGVAEASRTDSISLVFSYLQSILRESVTLLDAYHNYEEVIQLILDLFNTVASKQICYLGQSDTTKLYESSLAMIQTYAKHNLGCRKLSKDAEEDQFADVLTLMEMLTNLLSKDFIDLGITGDPVGQGSGEAMSAADVVLYGLGIVVPLMSPEMLKFPSLCTSYFRLIAYIAEIYPEKLCHLPDSLFQNVMASVDLGLSSFGSDICMLCLELLASLAGHLCQTKEVISARETLKHFVKSVMELLLLSSFDMDLMDTASTTLFVFICLHQEQYQQLVTELLSQQSDPVQHQRLLQAFSELTPPSLALVQDTRNRRAFMQQFSKFLVNVRAFLVVK